MKKEAPYDFKEHFMDEWSTIVSPIELANKFEEYEDVRRTLKPKSFNTYNKNKYEAKGGNKFENYPRKSDYYRNGNNKYEKKFQSNRSSYNDKNKPARQVNCCYCRTPGHYGVDCSKRPDKTKNNDPPAPVVQICAKFSQGKMRTRKYL